MLKARSVSVWVQAQTQKQPKIPVSAQPGTKHFSWKEMETFLIGGFFRILVMIT